MLGSRKQGSVKVHVLQIIFHLGQSASLPSFSSLSLAALGLSANPPPGPRSFRHLPGSLQLSLTCEQARPTDFQLEVELIFHGVGHVSVQESLQAQLVPGVQGPGAEAMPGFAGEGPRGGEGGRQPGPSQGQREKTSRRR